jgi:hypothetical protein
VEYGLPIDWLAINAATAVDPLRADTPEWALQPECR